MAISALAGDSEERNRSESPTRLIRSEISATDLTEAESGGRDVGMSLRTLPELARQLVGSDFAAVTVLDAHGSVTDMVYAGLTPEQASQIGHPPRGVGLLGKLGEQDRPLRLEKMSDHEDSAGFPPGHPQMESLLGVRVASGRGAKANLYVANLPGRPGFSKQDEQKVIALAAYARLALDNASLYEEERANRAAAEAAEQRLSAVIRGSSAGVVVKDAKTGEFVEVSGEALRVAGIDFSHKPEAGEHPFEALYHRPDGTKMSSYEIPMHTSLREHVSAGPSEVLFIRPDGTRIPVVVSAAPVFGPDGQLDSAVCVFVDVTKLKELERAKDEFLSMVTHDLRTPLTTIKGMAGAALEEARDSKRSDGSENAINFLEQIDEEVDYLTELISNLLDMTRIEAGADMFEPEICHLADIAQDSLARIGRSREAKARPIHSNVPPDLPAIFADPAQIGRVLDNLLSNALKYSEGDIAVSARSIGDGNVVRIEVADRGPGIPNDQMNAVFDRFARLKDAGRRGRQGSGLGLAICKSIVEAHSGKIGVDSSPRGSVFWFTLSVDLGGK